MKTLQEINEELKAQYGETSLDFTDKGAATGHGYIDFYASHFDPKRDSCRMLELGISCGGSAYLWSKYFGEDFDYYSIDIAGGFAQYCGFQEELVKDERISLLWQCNTFDPELAAQFVECDFVIDDGDHRPASQFASFQNYWHAVAKGGVYFIEDVVNVESAKQLTVQLEFYLKSIGAEYEMDTFYGKRLAEGRTDDIIIHIKKLN